MGRNESMDQFMYELVNISPQLRALLDEHVADNNELISSMLLGDVTELVQNSVEGGHASPQLLRSSEVSRILLALESSMVRGSSEVIDLIRTSFLENLEPDRAAYSTIKALMGPQLRQGLALFEC